MLTHPMPPTSGRLAAYAFSFVVVVGLLGATRPYIAAGSIDSQRTHGLATVLPDGGDTLVIGYWGDETILGPAWGSPARHLVFEPLFRGNYTRPGEVVAALVTSWEPSDDYRTWTYHLRSDVRWHDGTPLTASDVKFTQDLRQHPAVGDRMEPESQVVRVLDDTTFQITYRVPMNPTPWLSVWPKHLLEHLDPEEFWEWEFWSEPVGSGPYRYVRQVDEQLVELEANPDYFGKIPSISHAVFRFDIWETFDSVKGGIDGFGAPVALTPDFRTNSPDYRVYTWEQPATGTALCWNHRNPLFGEVSIRRALTIAIDRHELARLRGFPDWTYARDVVAPFYPGGFDRGPATTFDPAEARSILDQAGWTDVDGDGIREREGEEFSFTLVVSGAARDVEAAEHIQQDLARVGVRVEIELRERARIARDDFMSGQADAAIFRISLGAVARMFGDDSPVGFDDPEFFRSIEAANAAWDPRERRKHLNAAMARFREVLPVTVLLPDVQSSVAHRRVKGLRSPDKGDVVEFLSELWIEEDEGRREPGQIGGYFMGRR